MEIFKDIVGYEGMYQVSNFGRVKSVERKAKKWDGERKIKEKILKPSFCRGYAFVGLSSDGVAKSTRVHTLVAYHFIGERPEGFYIDHIDGNPKNNNHINLQYITPRGNVVKGDSCKGKESKFIGVTRQYRCDKNPWVSRIYINGKSIHLGMFKTELEASNAYQAKLKEINNVIN